MKLFVLAASLSTASSFVAVTAPPLASAPAALRAAGGAKSDAEAHMDVMPKIWDELKKAERDIVVQQQVGEIDEAAASKAMAEKLLETALDYVRTKERIEEDLASTAHRLFEHAVEEEKVLEEHVTEQLLNDIPADSYIDERFHQAQEMEKHAHEEEIEHLEKWAELRMEEEAIKANLRELKDMKPEDLYPGMSS